MPTTATQYATLFCIPESIYVDTGSLTQAFFMYGQRILMFHQIGQDNVP